MKNTGASSIVCFTILVLPVLLDEEYWSFQYHVFYNTSITSIVGWRILELPLLCINQRFWYSSIVNARYWYIQYCIYTILDFRYCNITMLVFLVQYCKYYNTGITGIAAGCFILSKTVCYVKQYNTNVVHDVGEWLLLNTWWVQFSSIFFSYIMAKTSDLLMMW